MARSFRSTGSAGLRSPARCGCLVVVPTYNERENVKILLPAVRDAVPDADILVVDDDSPDGTGDVVEDVAAELGQITLLHRPGKQGLGSAYRDGFDHGLDHGYDVVVSMDVDLSHDPEVLPELLSMIEAGADAVIGSRYVPGGRRSTGHCIAVCCRAGGTATRRSCCGCRYATAPRGIAPTARSALKEIDPGSTTAEGYAFLTELVRRLVRGQPARGRDADRVPRSSLRHVEDVRPHRRRVDVVGDDVGAARRGRRRR